ncbi:hypothetical protein PPL_12346 [Heterostelium album PN500]|uniref:Uncharacterized protein n=1 Tax=Heterostelium pallidum (strain ATCC 26659 / Pp 5 / PN500) TaxID=670386 RepID=D3BMD3_HETP5|nr:hypothetical protein PPL_12346 [Heterostelium album PN500]EFA77734.1 hypothetical protein PPL_12346 [Heterostelium album PN500]|eukprot:XP_020429862.1 hypothetical protein PPL_12346 [Heterostelium album PN500]
MEVWETLLPGITKCTPLSFYGALAMHIAANGTPGDKVTEVALTKVIDMLLSSTSNEMPYVLSNVTNALASGYPEQVVRVIQPLKHIDAKIYEKLKELEKTNEQISLQLKNISVSHVKNVGINEKAMKIINGLFDEYNNVSKKQKEKKDNLN